MRTAILGLALTFALVASSIGAAQPAGSPPAAIRSFSLAETESMGREIYRQDRLAWRATDALLAQKVDPAKEKLRGWVTLPGSDQVRFVRATETGYEAAYDITVPARGKPRIESPVDRILSTDEQALLAAKETAAKNVGPICGPGGYNFAAMKDAGGGWIVWLLAPMREAGALPIGGHYRFTISADGKTLIRRDALSNSCLVLKAPPLPKGAKPLGLALNHVVSEAPLETHVFASLQTPLPLIVMIGAQPRWIIVQGSIRPFAAKSAE